MKEFKGTKGKWEIFTDEFDNHNITSNNHYLGEARHIKDAKLIASAPEMLEMLEIAKSEFGEYHFLYNAIDILIKKATE